MWYATTMPRPPRADEAVGLYHALNRANMRAEIFKKEADYEAFGRILHEGHDPGTHMVSAGHRRTACSGFKRPTEIKRRDP